MKIFCQDKKLNISPPTFSRASRLAVRACRRTFGRWPIRPRQRDLQLPILTSILPSNEMQIARGLQLILENRESEDRRVGLQLQGRTDDLARAR